MKKILESLLLGISGLILGIILIAIIGTIHGRAADWPLILITCFLCGFCMQFWSGIELAKKSGLTTKNWDFIIVMAWTWTGGAASGLIINNFKIGLVIGMGFGWLLILVKFLIKDKLLKILMIKILNSKDR